MNPERFERIRSVLDRRQPDLTVVLEEVHKPHNFSAIVRTCDAAGVFEAHAVAPEGSIRASEAIARGAARWVRLVIHRSLDDLFGRLRGRGFRTYAAHPGGATVDYREVDYTAPTAVLFGQEKDGVSEAALRRVDQRLTIPMEGMAASLNVSVAAALVLYEARRQREAAGLYGDGPRLEPNLYRRTMFEWAYPYFADLCRRTGTEYPELGPEGEILGELPRG